MTIKELREKTGMNRKEFSDLLKIPYRTVQDWEDGKYKCKDYMIRAFYYHLIYLGKIKEAPEKDVTVKESEKEL